MIEIDSRKEQAKRMPGAKEGPRDRGHGCSAVERYRIVLSPCLKHAYGPSITGPCQERRRPWRGRKRCGQVTSNFTESGHNELHGRHIPFIAKAAAPSGAVRLALGPGGNSPDNAVVHTSITASAATAGLTAGKKLGEDVQVRAAT